MEPSQNTDKGIIGHIGGARSRAQVYDSLVFMGIGAELAILDCTDPAHPKRAAFVVFPALVTGVWITDHVAYVVDFDRFDDTGRLHILDIRQPASPDIIGSIQIVMGATALVVHEGIAYVSDFWHGLQIFDVASPTEPRLLASWEIDGGGWNLALRYPYLYLAAGNAGMRVLDVTQPAHPHEVASYTLPNEIYALVVRNDHVYIAGRRHGLRILDVSQPAQPQEVGAFLAEQLIVESVTLFHQWVAISGYRIDDYTLDGQPGVLVDVSAPTQPRVIGSLPPISLEVLLSDEYGLWWEPSGVAVAALHDPMQPTLLGRYTIPQKPWEVAVHSSMLVLTSDWDGFCIVDASDPTSLVPVHLDLSLRPICITQVTAAVCCVGEGGRIILIDITNPTQPTHLGRYTLPPVLSTTPYLGSRTMLSPTISAVAASATHIWILAGHQHYDTHPQITIVDSSDPQQLSVLATLKLDEAPYAIALEDSYALVVTEASFLVLQYTSTSELDIVGRGSGGGDALTVAWPYAYIVGREGLTVYHLSEPTQPKRIANLATFESGTGVVVRGRWLYVADQTARASGLRVFDIALPEQPREMAFYPIPGEPSDIVVTDEAVYIPAGETGLFVLRPKEWYRDE
jgi:hypothetical protein